MTDTKTKTVADELRDAAKTLRETADARWIGLTSPLLAEPLASWLEKVADEADRHEAQGMGNSQDEIIHGPCLAVARVVNGAAS